MIRCTINSMARTDTNINIYIMFDGDDVPTLARSSEMQPVANTKRLRKHLDTRKKSTGTMQHVYRSIAIPARKVNAFTGSRRYPIPYHMHTKRTAEATHSRTQKTLMGRESNTKQKAELTFDKSPPPSRGRGGRKR